MSRVASTTSKAKQGKAVAKKRRLCKQIGSDLAVTTVEKLGPMKILGYSKCS